MSGGDWLSWMDGADSDAAVKARNDAISEVAWLGAGAFVASAGLGLLEGYNHAKDPLHGGMPQLGPVAMDSVVGIAGIVGAIFFGDTLGEKGQLAALGAGIAGLSSAVSHYARVMGAEMYAPSSTHGNDKNTKTGNLKEKSNLSPESDRVFQSFLRNAA